MVKMVMVVLMVKMKQKLLYSNEQLNLTEIDWPIFWRHAPWHEEQPRHSWNTPTEACSISPTPTSQHSGGQRRKWKVSNGQNLKIPRGFLPFFSECCIPAWLGSCCTFFFGPTPVTVFLNFLLLNNYHNKSDFLSCVTYLPVKVVQ